MSLWFAEQKGLRGWTPVTFDEEPRVTRKMGAIRLLRNGHIGQRLRAEPRKVEPGHEHLTLDQLLELYGVDGKFRATVGAQA